MLRQWAGSILSQASQESTAGSEFEPTLNATDKEKESTQHKNRETKATRSGPRTTDTNGKSAAAAHDFSPKDVGQEFWMKGEEVLHEKSQLGCRDQSSDPGLVGLDCRERHL